MSMASTQGEYEYRVLPDGSDYWMMDTKGLVNPHAAVDLPVNDPPVANQLVATYQNVCYTSHSEAYAPLRLNNPKYHVRIYSVQPPKSHSSPSHDRPPSAHIAEAVCFRRTTFLCRYDIDK